MTSAMQINFTTKQLFIRRHRTGECTASSTVRTAPHGRPRTMLKSSPLFRPAGFCRLRPSELDGASGTRGLYNPSRLTVRKQYYFRESERGLLAWDVDRLCELSRG